MVRHQLKVPGRCDHVVRHVGFRTVDEDLVGDDEHPSASPFIELSDKPVALAHARFHTCAALSNGSMQCWGRGLLGALGYGNKRKIGDNETPASVGVIPGFNTGSVEVDAEDRLLRFGSKTIAWSANGEIQSVTDSSTSETRSYTYDLLGNLKQVILPSKTINYSVDAHDRRVVKKNGSVTS